MTIRDLRTRPREAQKTLAAAGEAILTSNGRPVALMVRVDSESLDETVETLRRARALQALREIRREAKSRGLDKLSATRIDALMTKTRRARRRG